MKRNLSMGNRLAAGRSSTIFLPPRKWSAAIIFPALGKCSAVIILLAIMCSCRSVRYVPVETVRTDSVLVNSIQRDSVHLIDSVFVREKGDTVWLEKYRYLYRDRVTHDTVSVVKVDTVRIPYPVERELTRWQRFKMDAGGVAFGGIVVIVLVVVGWMVYRLRK